jgi:hypothetical protein
LRIGRHARANGDAQSEVADSKIITRSRSVSSAVANRDGLAEVAVGLLQDNMPFPKPVRLLGRHCLPCRSEMVRSRNWIPGFDPE